jgi:catechol 2,3-dioxygenase-like lactoylglutathione lyase family enzyme
MSKPGDDGYTVVGLKYFTIYVDDLPAAVDFYTRVLGAPEVLEDGKVHGWNLGNTWLTVFPSRGSHYGTGSPRCAEFALEVSSPEEVDQLLEALLAAGAKPGWDPEDTWMYERMRFAYVVDPFGTTVDIFCPLPAEE